MQIIGVERGRLPGFFYNFPFILKPRPNTLMISITTLKFPGLPKITKLA